MLEKLDKQHRYPWPVIETAIQWYQKEELTYRAVSDKLQGHGIGVSHKTIFEWVQKFGETVSKKAKMRIVKLGWGVEETYVKVNGDWKYMYRAIDKKSNTLNLVFRERRNLNSAKTFLKKALTDA